MKLADAADDASQVGHSAGQQNDLPPDPTATEGGAETRPTRSRLWLWIVAAFVVQALAWTAWLVIASKHPIEEVPVVRTQAR